MPESKGKMRGCKPTPRHKLLAARPFVPRVPPPTFAVVPGKLDLWGNGDFGNCTTAEEAFAKAMFSLMCGLPELFVPPEVVIAWCRKHGFLNGADLVEVMQALASDGFVVDGKAYTDGPPFGVDYSDENLLRSAISTGPVKIGIDADALPSNAGDVQGWFCTSKGNWRTEDHAVALCGYGPAGFLFDALKVPLPPSLGATTAGYLLYTWATIGMVSHDWLMGACFEAWVRNPTTPGQVPTPPTPPVPPGPPDPMYNVLSLTTDLPAGNYPIGFNAGVDPAKLLPILLELADLLGIPVPRDARRQLEQANVAGALPWAKVIQIAFLVMAFMSKGGNITPADIQALIAQILAILAG